MAFTDSHGMGGMVDFNTKLKCAHCKHRYAIYYGNKTLFCWQCKTPTEMTPTEYQALKAKQKEENDNNPRLVEAYIKMYKKLEDWELEHRLGTIKGSTYGRDCWDDVARLKALDKVMAERGII